MFIDNETKRRVNIHAPYKGFSRLDSEGIRIAAGVVEIPDPVRESDETHYNQEIDEAPYLVSTPKPQEMVDAAFNAKINAQIAGLELSALMPRAARDMFKGILEKEATALGATKEQLYAANIGYKKLVDLDTEIAALRAQLRK